MQFHYYPIPELASKAKSGESRMLQECLGGVGRDESPRGHEELRGGGVEGDATLEAVP